MSDIAVIQQDIIAARPTFSAVLADKSINFERELEFAIQVLSKNEYAMKIAMGNRQSVVDSIVNVSAIGISLNPAKRHAYLVPREGRICLDVSYLGLMHLAIKGGGIKWAQAAVVRQMDTFALTGIDSAPTHVFNPFSKAEERGQITGAYVTAKTKDDEFLTHTMTIEQITAIRDKSPSWIAHKTKGKSTPWVDFEEEMIRKTVVKQASKYWPIYENESFALAVQHLNTELGEGIIVNDVDEPVNDWQDEAISRIDQCQTIPELQALWGELIGELRLLKVERKQPILKAIESAKDKRKSYIDDGVVDVEAKESANG